MNLSQKDINSLNDFSGLLSFKPTWASKEFMHEPAKTVGFFTGNQYGKTGTVARSYVMRVLGWHPVAKKNIVYFECERRVGAKLAKIENPGDWKKREDYLEKHESFDSATWNVKKIPKDLKCPECGSKVIQHVRSSRVIRFCSDSLPNEASNVGSNGLSAEVKNTQYPEFKRWLPQFLIKKDLTSRRFSMILQDVHGGADIIVEFVSYNQSAQSTAGTQRVSIWLDEQPPPAFYEEQRPRLLKEDGDFVISCTPADRMSFLYDDVFERARIYYRTKIIADKLKLPQIEETDSPDDIAVIQAATDDNPTLSKDDIDSLLDEWASDPDKLDIRRYGIFKQISGRIYKNFDWRVNVISKEDYFPDGVPHNWSHFRGIDYHPHVNWACLNMSISQHNECFIWAEFNPDPENMVTLDIAREFALLGKDYKFTLNLIDPLADVTQVNTGLSSIDDLNRLFHEYRRENIGTGGYWNAWDTKSTRGREEVRKRFKNSALAGVPFNNRVVKNGLESWLPTIWILDNCRITAKSFKNWRLEEWVNNSVNATKERKEIPQQRWSHFCQVVECLFKNPACRPRMASSGKGRQKYNRFKGETHAVA